MIQPIRTYADFKKFYGNSGRLRTVVRDTAVLTLSIGRSIKNTSGWIRFPYYHHVFDDERHGFTRQLNYMRDFGEFISLDDVVGLLNSGEIIDGRYFCITFDDGFKNCLTNAVPILLDKGAPAVFFMATGYINSDPEKDTQKLLGFFDLGTILIEFLSWQDCRDMSASGMTIGSHTVNHVRLAKLSEEEAQYELNASKTIIEKNLGQACNHFCSPFGIPNDDYNVERDPDLVRESGYMSMSTTERGATRKGGFPYEICRDHTLANWSNHQLRYFFSL